MRLERNRFAAEKLLALCADLKPDVILVPNGTIQELGAAYRVAKHLGIPVSTYEFSDQKDRIWLAQNSEIMRQETDALWQARKDVALTTEQKETIQSFTRPKYREIPGKILSATGNPHPARAAAKWQKHWAWTTALWYCWRPMSWETV